MEQKQITIVVAVIRNDKGEILLAKRNDPKTEAAHNKWELVGGGIDFGENPEEAVIREVKEEAGVVVEIVRLLPKVFSEELQISDSLEMQVIILTYECKIVSGNLTPGLQEEISELKFVPLNEVKNYDTFKNIQKTVSLLNT